MIWNPFGKNSDYRKMLYSEETTKMTIKKSNGLQGLETSLNTTE